MTEPHRFGTHALQWQIEAGGDGREYWVTQTGISPTLLAPGHKYEVTGSYMTDQLGDIGFNYIVRGQPGDEPNIGTVADAPTHPSAVNVWETFRFEFTIPAGAAPASYEVYLHAIKFTTTAVNLTVDGVSLHPKT